VGSQKQLKQDARSSSIGKTDKRVKVPFAEFRFVRIELSEKEKSEFKALLDSGEFAEIPLDEWLDRGYKLTVSRDDKSSGVICSVTAVYTNAPDAGLVLTARGRDAITALSVLAYKDKYLAGDAGWLACESSRGGSYDDIG